MRLGRRAVDELRIWLRKIDMPKASMSGMIAWEHLTRDRSFDPDRKWGVHAEAHVKLHRMAHYGHSRRRSAERRSTALR